MLPIRSGRPGDRQPPYQARRQLSRDASQNLWRHQPQLGCPRRRFGRNLQITLGQLDRAAPGGYVATDDRLPLRHQPGLGKRSDPTKIGQRPPDDPADRLWVAIVRSGAAVTDRAVRPSPSSPHSSGSIPAGGAASASGNSPRRVQGPGRDIRGRRCGPCVAVGRIDQAIQFGAVVLVSQLVRGLVVCGQVISNWGYQLAIHPIAGISAVDIIRHD